MLRVARSDSQRRDRQIKLNCPTRSPCILLQQRRLRISHRGLERRDRRPIADDGKLVRELDDVEGEAKGETKGGGDLGRVRGGSVRGRGVEGEGEGFDRYALDGTDAPGGGFCTTASQS
mgnify:FL=1